MAGGEEGGKVGFVVGLGREGMCKVSSGRRGDVAGMTKNAGIATRTEGRAGPNRAVRGVYVGETIAYRR